jgi:hypothetical protein
MLKRIRAKDASWRYRQRKKARRRRWIQKAVNPRHKGLLHRELGVPQGRKIPMAKLRRALKMGGKIARRAQFAINMRKFQRKKRRRK